MAALKNIIFKEPTPFSQKRDLNKVGIIKVSVISVLVLVIGLLVMPSQNNEQAAFHEKVDAAGNITSKPKDNDPTNQTIQELKASQASMRGMPNPNRPVSGPVGGLGSSGSNGSDRNVSMILARSGNDTRNALSIGTRIPITLTQSLTLSSQTMPVTGVVSSDVVADSSLAIPEGSKVLGDASFDGSNERANVVWKSIILPDGRERTLSAVSVGNDNQVGVEGNVKSDALKNTIGQTLTGFIGAYAQGSMSSGMLGAQDGGVQNGLKNAVSQTAQARANDYGEGLKKEHKWIELAAGTAVIAVLSQTFVYRDPGNTYGK